MKKWEILHVPDKLPFSPNHQPTVDVFASIIEPKLAHTLIRLRLNQIAPLENFRHIKRVRKKNSVGGVKTQLSVILCLAGENENQLESIPNDVLELINAHQLSPFIAKVAKYPALSKEDWEEQCKLWPTSYHPPTYNIDGITGFSEDDSQSIFNFMKAALELTKAGPCNDQIVNVAVIVDPSVRQVIASANDQTCWGHSATMNTSLETGCITQPNYFTSHQSDADAVAINEALPSNCARGEHKQSYNGVSCLYPWNWSGEQLYAGNTCSWHPLRHAAIVAIEYAAARDRRLFPGSGGSEDQPFQVDHIMPSSMSLPAKRQKIDLPKDEDDVVLKACPNGSHSEGARPYLCTGFDIFLAWEPCSMCAMALVHQRIRRIFYAFPNPNCGALGSVYRLQGEKSLNHHYAVFRVLLPEEVLDDMTQKRPLNGSSS
ncbi:CMP/dCMP deaminase [Macleaya cordata]|uniref:CMP/dCMP deaminase n=1 Tax=Macleaya cordata TaxID=56857 RepID=A0A200PS99_MACCD|nr:CMP/dCMP deaminase [Macleaya cordata]